MAKRYPKEFLAYLIGEVELTPKELAYMTRDEVLDTLLAYEGFGQYAGYAIRTWIKDIYSIDLTNYEEYLNPESLAILDGLEEY